MRMGIKFRKMKLQLLLPTLLSQTALPNALMLSEVEARARGAEGWRFAASSFDFAQDESGSCGFFGWVSL